MLNEDFEEELAKVRQALTNSVAVEKQIEQQMKKLNENIETWTRRVELARSNQQEDMATVAEQRVSQFSKSKNELAIEQLSQQDFTAGLKKDLARLEARRFTAGSSGAAQALAATEGSLEAMDKLEHKVSAQEIEAKLGSEQHELDRKFAEQCKKDALDDELEKLKASLKKD